MDIPFSWTHPATVVSGCDGQKETKTFQKMPALAVVKIEPGHCEDPWRTLQAGGWLSMNNKRPESSMSSSE